jgi:UDP-N-acetylmuramate dehydrogenase
MMATSSTIDLLRARFGDEIKTNVSLARCTSARVGGPAEFLITANSADELAEIVSMLWRAGEGYLLLGGGSNVLVSDLGVRGVTILNRAKAVQIVEGATPHVWAESGAMLGNVAKRCGLKGLAGLEWAATVPGTVGGAVYGNAGAFGGDMAGSLAWAEIVTPAGRERRSAEALGYGYRTSVLKRGEARAVVLSAEIKLEKTPRAEIAGRMAKFNEARKASQPPGASMGSMFKNPAGDKAGRLLDAAGLKGTQVGTVEISPVHANFFVNHGRARATDVRELIELARNRVKQEFGVELELEIELVGDWA